MYYKGIKKAAQARSASDLSLNLIDALPRFTKYEVMDYRNKQQYVDTALKPVLIGANDCIIDVAYNFDYEVGYQPLEHVMLFYEDAEPYAFDVTGDSIQALLRDVFIKGLEKGLI